MRASALNAHENNNNADYDDIEARRRMSHDTGYESGRRCGQRREMTYEEMEGKLYQIWEEETELARGTDEAIDHDWRSAGLDLCSHAVW